MDKTFSSEYAEVKADRHERRRAHRQHASRKSDIDSADLEERNERRMSRLDEVAQKKQRDEDRLKRAVMDTRRLPRPYVPPLKTSRPSHRFANPKAVLASTARRLLECIRGGDDCLEAPACHVHAAVKLILALECSQRPARMSSLASFLKRRGCCTVKSAALVEPDSLIAALPAALPDDVPAECRGQLVLLAGRARRESAAEELPEPVRIAASLAAMDLKMMGYDAFVQLKLKAKARWFCEHSIGAVHMNSAALAEEFIRQGLAVPEGEQGRILYNESQLRGVPKPHPRVTWAAEDVGFIADTLYRELRLPLGYGHFAVEAAKTLRNWSLTSLAADWRSSAWAAVAETCNTFIVDSYKTWTETWTEAENWGVVLIIAVSSLTPLDDSSALDLFMDKLEEAAAIDIDQACTPGEMSLERLSTRGEHEKLKRDAQEELLDAKVRSGHFKFGSANGTVKRW